jgi:hypothetical protein
MVPRNSLGCSGSSGSNLYSGLPHQGKTDLDADDALAVYQCFIRCGSVGDTRRWPTCMRLCSAYPSNPRSYIEGESPRLRRRTYGLATLICEPAVALFERASAHRFSNEPRRLPVPLLYAESRSL